MMAHRQPNRPPGACCLSSALGFRPFGPETVPRTVSGTGLTPRQALETHQLVAAYGLYGKTIANTDRHEKRPPRQAAARLGQYAAVFEGRKGQHREPERIGLTPGQG